jgi:DNA-damage-inducible protein J
MYPKWATHWQDGMARQTTTKRNRRSTRKAAAPAGKKTAQVRARIDPTVKEQAESILEELGLNPSAAISSFYSQIVLRRGLPFPVEVPNEVTGAAIEEARSGGGQIGAADLKELLSKLLTKRDRTVDLVELLENAPGLFGSIRR